MEIAGHNGVATPPKTLFVHHAARRIGCSVRTVRRFIQQGKLPAQRQGRRSWAISLTDVDHFLLRRLSSW